MASGSCSRVAKAPSGSKAQDATGIYAAWRVWSVSMYFRSVGAGHPGTGSGQGAADPAGGVASTRRAMK